MLSVFGLPALRKFLFHSHILLCPPCMGINLCFGLILTPIQTIMLFLPLFCLSHSLMDLPLPEFSPLCTSSFSSTTHSQLHLVVYAYLYHAAQWIRHTQLQRSKKFSQMAFGRLKITMAHHSS